MPPQFEIPTTMFALFATVMMIVLGLLVWFVKGVKSDQTKIADTQAAAATATALAFREVSNHMVTVNKGLDLIVGRLLDAVIVPLAKVGAVTVSTMREEPATHAELAAREEVTNARA